MPLKSTWKDEIPNVVKMMDKGVSLEAIGASYGVSKQRVYQILKKYGVETPFRKKTCFLRDMPPKYYWLDKMLTNKGFKGSEKNDLLKSLDLPDYCPVLGIELSYNGFPGAKPGWSRRDSSPSIDRVDSRLGYTPENIQIISWRANRIKNDGTPEELRLLADYMENKAKYLTKSA